MRLQFSIIALLLFVGTTASAQVNLESKLKSMDPESLAARVEERGSAKRGALVFFKSAAGCAKCHADSGDESPLGPSLASIAKDGTIQHVIESLLYPSKKIKDQYKTTRIVDVDGRTTSGIIVRKDETQTVLRDASDLSREVIVKANDIEAVSTSDVSMMPEGLVASLRDEREFYDLVRYISRVAIGGVQQANELRPSPDKLVVKDDTKNLDHAGILKALGNKDLRKGERIYKSHCVNCHGADGNTPSLATARAFGSQKLKFGADPLSMLNTLTRGNGLMAPMQHLSPRERYQVIHFIRDKFMKNANPDFVAITPDYLASLPKGTNNGEMDLGGERDYGPVLGSQLGSSINNSLTFRLPHGITVNYDLHRFRLGGVWEGGFLDLSQTQHYRQRGERMPQPKGTPVAGIDHYGWQLSDAYDISSDQKPPRGPVRDDLAKYKGHYLYDDQAVISYEIHGRAILENISVAKLPKSKDPWGRGIEGSSETAVLHTMRVAAGKKPLRLSVARQEGDKSFGFTLYGTDYVHESVPVKNYFAAAETQTRKKYESGGNKNVARHIVSVKKGAAELDLGHVDRTVVVRFRTKEGGTLIASAPEKGEWEANGKTLFVRGKRLVFDIGWVGAMVGKTNVADNQWHTAVLHVSEKQTQIYLDGKLEASKANFRRDPVPGHVLKIGATAVNFGGDFSGDIEFAEVYKGKCDSGALQELSKSKKSPRGLFWRWNHRQALPSQPQPIQMQFVPTTMTAVVGDVEGLMWEKTDDARLVLAIPPADHPRVFRLIRMTAPRSQVLAFQKFVRDSGPIADPITMTHGGPTRWPQELRVEGELGDSVNGYALDTIPIPDHNPWNAWIRTSALDFMSDGRCVVTTHGGDVYIVSGVDDDLDTVTWRRFASGLFEPFGVRVIDDQIYVTCRDGINRLHDYDDNGEADFVEAFWIDDDVSCMFHAYNFDLQTDSKGNFYFAKAGQYTHHHRPGTIMKVPPTGGKAEVVAWGIRTPNGMGKLSDDRFTVSDNQGPWMPAGKISLIKPDAFLGNMPINKEQDQWLREKHGGELPTTFDEPFIWMPQELDNSCGGQVWAGDDRWGPLSGRLIHSSFGKGWLYYLSLQEVDGVMQSSIVALPHQWDAGVMRLRINHHDGQMYGTGLSGWQGPNGGKDGCLQRLRYTGETARIVESVKVIKEGIELKFNFDVDQGAAENSAWKATMWNYLWSKKYGSDQFSVMNPGKKGRDNVPISEVAQQDRTLILSMPDLRSCDQLKLEIDIKDSKGKPFTETVYLTIHTVPE